ncbi:MAG: tyrosine-type recombinase/integrase [Bacillota bacterium]
MEQNPAADLQRPRMPKKLPRYLQKNEVDKLINIVPHDGSPSMLRDKTVLMCLYYTGVRAEEVINIQTVDMSLERGFVKITKGKGSRYRKVPLHQKLTEQLQLYFERAPELSNGYLFCSKRGGPISTDYVNYMVEKYAKKAGLNKKVTPHMLRHSFATHLYKKGIDLFVIGMLMGHAEMRSTSRYTHIELKHMRDAVNKLDIPKALEIKISKMEGSIDEP